MEGYNLFKHRDPSSFSQPDEAVVTELHLNVEVDFKQEILRGYVTLIVKRIKDSCRMLVLDSKDLTISRIVNVATEENLKFTLNEPLDIFGSKLVIRLPNDKENELKISIYYETHPRAFALKWLTPEYTVNKQQPFLFSQCQPINCRSIIPCQDTPSVKIIYTAQIMVPSELTVLMSAKREATCETDDGKKIFYFKQSIPIPTYLIAIAVGALERRQLGLRTSVWAEAEVVDKAAYEFANTEEMLIAAEQICGPYIWGDYELLVLPSSFPYGGMENPCLTFLSPTLLVGDRSLCNSVAHELAHSWTGNLVTPCSFEHFWLSEGFATFIERKILGRMEGETVRHFCALTGIHELEREIKTMGNGNNSTKLVLHLVNPDKAISLVPYEKGHTLLFYLEELVGGRVEFENFLRKFLQHFKYMSISTEDFKEYFNNYFENVINTEEINWSGWLDKPGMPLIIPVYTTILDKPCADLAARWGNWDLENTCPFTENDLNVLSFLQIQAFLIHLLLLDLVDLCLTKVKFLGKLYFIDSFQHSEIRFRWLLLCIEVHWIEKLNDILHFVNQHGRLKFILPIYRKLYEWIEVRDKVLANFTEFRHTMTQISEEKIAKTLYQC